MTRTCVNLRLREGRWLSCLKLSRLLLPVKLHRNGMKTNQRVYRVSERYTFPSPFFILHEKTNIHILQAALTTISSLALFDNDIRSYVTDSLHLIPYIQSCLTHHHVGVRYAATQCVRALSRAVSVLRTNIMDSGLGMDVYGKVFCKESEDRRVVFAASAVVCNLVNECSPLRQVWYLGFLISSTLKVDCRL